MKLYERIENNNFDEIDRNRAIELIESGNGHLVYNENYFKLQKENEELKEELETEQNERLLCHIREKQMIPVQKVKDKIEEIQEEGYWLFTTDRDSDKCVEVLQQLLKKEQII